MYLFYQYSEFGSLPGASACRRMLLRKDISPCGLYFSPENNSKLFIKKNRPMTSLR